MKTNNMSSGYFKNSDRKVVIVKSNNSSFHNDSYDESDLSNICNKFDTSLRISITNKLCQLSGRINESRVSIGPDADSDVLEKKEEKVAKSPNLNGSVNFDHSRHSNKKFSKEKILVESDLLRKENVQKIIEKKKKEMETATKNFENRKMAILHERTAKKEKESEENIAKLEAEEEKRDLLFEEERKNKIEQQKLQENEELMSKIRPFQAKFYAQMKDISTLSKNCKDKEGASQALNTFSEPWKNFHEQMEILPIKAQRLDLTQSDVSIAEMIVGCNEQIYEIFKTHIDKIDTLYDEELAQREIELKQAEVEAQKEALLLEQLEQEQLKLQQQIESGQQAQSQVDSAVSVQPPPYSPDTVPDSTGVLSPENESESLEYPDLESIQIFVESQKFLEDYKVTFDDFVKSDLMKKFKFECQKTLNITINSISHVSREQLIDKYEKLKMFLSGKSSPNILTNRGAENFSKNLLAKKIVDQGITTISSKPELAFPFAAIAVAIWNDWPDFGQLLLAHFRTVSPFFVPVFLVQRSDQSDEDYYKSLGCKYREDGTPEQPEQFWKRMGGIMYLYASIMITKQRQGVNKPHPHGIGNAWRWLAATLNIEPRSDTADICATLIYTLLEITGHTLYKTYPNQFPKLLEVLDKVYCAKLKSFNSGALSAPISRLNDFISLALQKKAIPAPKNQLPPNFW